MPDCSALGLVANLAAPDGLSADDAADELVLVQQLRQFSEADKIDADEAVAATGASACRHPADDIVASRTEPNRSRAVFDQW